MLPESDAILESARTAAPDEIENLIHESNEKILLSLIGNPNLSEKHVEALLGRPEISSVVISALVDAGDWLAHEKIRLKIAQHPHSPKRLALAALRRMFLFDLVRVAQIPAVACDIRRAAEEQVLSRVPHLPVGEKLTLARRAPARIAAAILADGHPQAIKFALENPYLTESQILKIMAKEGVPERVVAAISRHEKWSLHYNVRVALVRNAHTPRELAHKFVEDLTFLDLQNLAGMPGLPSDTKSRIAVELEARERNMRNAAGKP